ncbi:MAG: hypothetical protein IPI35_10790 [Deltaproteobacteria bacterium]|nr:hypothetical protein [Deltaproteobacteria bacterium]
MRAPQLLLMLVASAASADAQAASGSVGAIVSMSQDLPDGATVNEPVGLGFAPTLVVPARLSLGPGGPALRATLSTQTAAGWARVSGGPDDAPIDGLRQDARHSFTSLSVGPELRVPMAEAASISPYFGAELGLGLAATRVTLSGEARGIVEDDLGLARQLRPMIGVSAGIDLHLSSRVAVSIEAGYTVSRTPARVLTPSGADLLSTSDFALNAFRLGFGVLVPVPSNASLR